MHEHRPIDEVLTRIGGQKLQQKFKQHQATTPVVKTLPHAEADTASYSYCIMVGGLATIADGMLDRMFREEMKERHKELDPDAQQAREDKVKEYLKEQGLNPERGPTMSMDYYDTLNKELGLRSPFKLRAANHRILNHADRDSVIAMLMEGKAGLGGSIDGLYPKMTLEQATRLYELHMSADRGTPQSIPLKMMAWLWEHSARAGNPEVAGDASFIYKFLHALAPNGDWSGWINRFCEGNPIPSPATLGEAMLKLYDLGILNERVFWTSDAGAAVGGFKRRAVITIITELSVELYALFEGVRLGHVRWIGTPEQLGKDILRWRDQPKYVDMKIIVQALASSYGAFRTVAAKDPWSLNVTSMGMIIKHLSCYPAMLERHYTHLVAYSRDDVANMKLGFTERTGINLPGSTREEKQMPHPFDQRIMATGCVSTRVRVLGKWHQERMTPLVERMERLGRLASSNDTVLEIFDPLCTGWYLSEVEDDEQALAKLAADIDAAERAIQPFVTP